MTRVIEWKCYRTRSALVLGLLSGRHHQTKDVRDESHNPRGELVVAVATTTAKATITMRVVLSGL